MVETPLEARIECAQDDFDDAIYTFPAPKCRPPYQFDPRSTIVEWRRFDIPASKEKRERFITRYERHLERLVGEGIASGATMVLNEALMNAEEHAHKYDPAKKARVYSMLFEDRLYLSVQTKGPGFDPRKVRTSGFNDDGSVYNTPRGRGYIMMVCMSDKLLARNKGRELYALIGLRDPRTNKTVRISPERVN